MKPSIKKKFLDLKINLINQQKSDKVTIIANRNSLDPVLRVIWCASIFNKYKKHNIILFSSKKFEFFNKIFQNFGIKKTVYFENYDLLFKNFFKKIYFLLKSLFYYFYFSYNGIDYFIDNFQVNNIKIGKNIHESYLKKNKFYESNKLLLPLYYFKFIFSAYILINSMEKYFLKKKVKNIIINKKEYFSIDSILFLIAKKYRIRSIILQQDSILIKKNIAFNEEFYTLKKKDLNQKINEKLINRFIKKRFNGLTDIDSENAFLNKKKINFKILENFISKKKRKIVLFCPHAFSDSPSAGGKFLYRDFYEYFERSINEMAKIKDINWIVKLHPTRFTYGEQSIGENYIKKMNCKNIILIPDYFSTSSLIKIVDSIVTGRGTIIAETAFLGKKTLAYSNTRFKNSDIYIKYNNVNDYYKKLRFKDLDLKISNVKKKLAKKMMYIIHQKIFRTPDNLLFDTRRKNKKELKYLYIKLFENLKKGKSQIFKSNYYKKLLTKFI